MENVETQPMLNVNNNLVLSPSQKTEEFATAFAVAHNNETMKTWAILEFWPPWKMQLIKFVLHALLPPETWNPVSNTCQKRLNFSTDRMEA